MIDKQSLAAMIDYSLLKIISREKFVKGCKEAALYKFASVTVNPANVQEAVKLLGGSGVPVGTVAGFSLGATITEAKIVEAQKALEYGAVYVDMVLNIYALKAGDFDLVYHDICGVKNVVRDKGLTRVILENCYLTDNEKIIACELCIKAGADFVKTSTGYGPSGASVDDMRLMVKTAKGRIKVKAAGGIYTLNDALAMINAGADRLAFSKSLDIMAELDAMNG